MAKNFAKRVWSQYEIGRLETQMEEIKSSLRQGGGNLTQDQVNVALDRIGKLTELKRRRLESL